MLGELQQRLLIRIFEQYLEYARDNFPGWQRGVDWHGGGRTRAEQAAISRALARLEACLLIKRVNVVSGRRRVTHIQIRPAGIQIAERLTNQQGIWMLTVGTRDVPAPPAPMTADEFQAEIERIRAAKQ